MASNNFDVAIVGGSAAGIAAALTLGRSMRTVVVFDDGNPCNIQALKSHNFITRDGIEPAEFLSKGREELANYETVRQIHDRIVAITGEDGKFELSDQNGNSYQSEKVILATGLHDEMPEIVGFAQCWGISVLHCPYCHGYEVAGKPTIVFANGEAAYHLSVLISNWTKSVTVVTNGISELRHEEAVKIENLGIKVIEKPVQKFIHQNGRLQKIAFDDGSQMDTSVMYASVPFKQHSTLAEELGCKMTSGGHIDVDDQHRTSIAGVYAAGDCIAQPRALSVASASGTKAAFTVNAEWVLREREIL